MTTIRPTVDDLAAVRAARRPRPLYVGLSLTETDDEYAARVIAGSHRAHGRACAGRCLTRAYALAAGGIAVLVVLHVALGW